MSTSVEVKPKSGGVSPSTTPRNSKEANPLEEGAQGSNNIQGDDTNAVATTTPAPEAKTPCCSCPAIKLFGIFYRIFKFIVLCSLLLMGAASALLALSFHESNSLDDIATGFGILAQAGFIVLVLVLCLAEIGPKWFLKYFYLFNFWAGRGLALVWMGIESIGNVESLGSIMAVTNATVKPADVQTIGRVSGWSLIATGVLYVFMSFFCLRVLGGFQKDSCEQEPNHNAEAEGTTAAAADGTAQPAKEGQNQLPREMKESHDAAVSWLEATNDQKYAAASNAAIALGMTLTDLMHLFTGQNGEPNAYAFFEMQEAKLKAAKATTPAAAGPGSKTGSPRGGEGDGANEMSLEERYYAAQATGVAN